MREIEWLEENEQKEVVLGRYVWVTIKYLRGCLKYLDFIPRWKTYQSILNEAMPMINIYSKEISSLF